MIEVESLPNNLERVEIVETLPAPDAASLESVE